MQHLSRVYEGLLVLAGIVMSIWGLFGLIEYIGGPAPISLQNPAFPPGMQFLHFAAILGSGLVFLVGYVMRWRFTPHAMIASCIVLATLCAVQTMDMLQNDNRYILFFLECTNYIVIGIYMLRSQRMQTRFGTTHIERAPL